MTSHNKPTLTDEKKLLSSETIPHPAVLGLVPFLLTECFYTVNNQLSLDKKSPCLASFSLVFEYILIYPTFDNYSPNPTHPLSKDLVSLLLMEELCTNLCRFWMPMDCGHAAIHTFEMDTSGKKHRVKKTTRTLSMEEETDDLHNTYTNSLVRISWSIFLHTSWGNKQRKELSAMIISFESHSIAYISISLTKLLFSPKGFKTFWILQTSCNWWAMILLLGGCINFICLTPPHN